MIFDAWENLDCVRAMLDHGGRIDIRSRDGNTPLLFYVGNGWLDAALPMLDRGAGIDSKTRMVSRWRSRSTTVRGSPSGRKNRCLMVISGLLL